MAGNTFLESFNQGLNLAHVVESDKRLAAESRRKLIVHQQTMQKYARDLLKYQRDIDLGEVKERRAAAGEQRKIATEARSVAKEKRAITKFGERGKDPAIPMYIKQPLGEGMEQRYRWNPATKAHDLPFGKPYKTKTLQGWQRKKRTYTDGGKTYAQEYDFNPKTREEKLVGKPYETKTLGSAIEQWLLKSDPKGIF